MKNMMSSAAKKVWQSFKDKQHRHAAVAAHIADTIATQIKAMREARGLSQQALADLTEMKQSRISALENEGSETVTVATLRRVAEAFDVALEVKFVSFKDLASSIAETSAGELAVSDYAEEKNGGDSAKK